MALGFVGGQGQVDEPEGDGAEAHREKRVAFVGAKRDAVGYQCAADEVKAVSESDFAFAFDGAGDFGGLVFDGRVFASEASWTDAIAGCGHIHPEGLMGSVMVVIETEGIEALLREGEGWPVVAAEQLVVEGAVEALVLALGLGVQGASVDDLDTLAQEPEPEGTHLGVRRAPGRAVVAEDLAWQAVKLEGAQQVLAHAEACFVGTGSQADQEARVVVKDGERMAAPARGEGEVPLEVHLPEHVGLRSFEAHKRRVFFRLRRVNHRVSF